MSHASLGLLARCWLAELLPALPFGLVVVWHILWRLDFAALFMLVTLPPLWAFFSWAAYGEWRPSLFLWRFSRRVIRFRTVSSDRVTVLFPADLHDQFDLAEVMRIAGMDLGDLAQRFGFSLRRRLTIVVVPSHRDLTADFGRPMGGTMLMPANAVVLAFDCPFREGLRHELAHLFAARWNVCPPPLFEEGLAVWLQEADPGRTDTTEGFPAVHPFDRDPSLLLDRRHFFAPDRVYDAYAMAGDFTGFLVRHFGWDRYRQFYRRADLWTFRARFKKHYGMRLEEAWLRCHDESVAVASLAWTFREDGPFNPLL